MGFFVALSGERDLSEDQTDSADNINKGEETDPVCTTVRPPKAIAPERTG